MGCGKQEAGVWKGKLGLRGTGVPANVMERGAWGVAGRIMEGAAGF